MRIRIAFSDVDMHGHVHNGVYFSYVETAINELLRDAGLLGHFDPRSEEHVYYAKKVEIVYERPVGFDDVVDVRAALLRIGNTSLTFSGRVDRQGETRPSIAAQVVWVCVDPGTGRAMPVPEATRAALTAKLQQ